MGLGFAVLLGLLQGITEFLPVSSSGHLALAQAVIPGFHQPGVLFDAMLHVGTALAVVWYERDQIRRWTVSRDGRRMLGLLIIGTVATAAVGFALKGAATEAFHKPAWVGTALIVTGLVVASTRFIPGGNRGEDATTWKQVVLIGLVQGIAVFPGLSRSGITISAGLGVGLDRAWAARFSFLLAVPAIAGATLFELLAQRHEVVSVPASFWLACGVGGVAAALSGYFALLIVLKMVSASTFHRFAWYCIPLGMLVLLLETGIF